MALIGYIDNQAFGQIRTSDALHIKKELDNVDTSNKPHLSSIKAQDHYLKKKNIE